MGSDYGLWPLVVINTLLVLAFAVSFYHPANTARDWTVMGGFSAFLVALFTEMYGFPLTVYLVSGWLGSRFPLLRADHRGGHLLNDLIGWDADPHVSPFHLASYAFIGEVSGSSPPPGRCSTRLPVIGASPSRGLTRGCGTRSTWGFCW